MHKTGIAYLLYHELERIGGPPCTADDEYRRYVVNEHEFRRHLAYLRERGIRGLNVSEALRSSPGVAVAITFDDGCETDLTVAAPLLRSHGFHATYYIVVGSIGSPGRLSVSELRELSVLGGEIGCHTMTHPHLDDLSEQQLRHEIVDAKEELEQILGRRVENFSCPGGRWTHQVARIAREAGYVSVATSRIGVNSPETDPYCLSRVGIMRWTTPRTFAQFCQGEGLWRPQGRAFALNLAKKMLGNSRYDRIRSGLLRERE